MKFIVALTCPCCDDYDEDMDHHCFGRNPAYVVDNNDKPIEFSSREDAEEAGRKACDNGVYTYEIEERKLPK